jgi:hypothetical protein
VSGTALTPIVTALAFPTLDGQATNVAGWLKFALTGAESPTLDPNAQYAFDVYSSNGWFGIEMPALAEAVDDKAIRERVLDRLRAERWASPNSINIIVQMGVAELWGAVESEAKHKAVRITAETTPGVSAVKDNLIVMTIPSGI